MYTTISALNVSSMNHSYIEACKSTISCTVLPSLCMKRLLLKRPTVCTFCNLVGQYNFWSQACAGSVTRFGEISPLWQNFKSLGNFLNGLFSIWQTFVPTLAFYATGQIVLVVNGQRFKNNKNSAIWSL